MHAGDAVDEGWMQSRRPHEGMQALRLLIFMYARHACGVCVVVLANFLYHVAYSTLVPCLFSFALLLSLSQIENASPLIVNVFLKVWYTFS